MEGLIADMNDQDEKIRSAAAFALGGVVAGSVQKYFPSLLQYLQQSNQPHQRSLILHAIKEVIHLAYVADDRSSLSTRMRRKRNC